MAEVLLGLRLLLALLLYAFLGVFLYTLWRDLQQKSTPKSPMPTPASLFGESENVATLHIEVHAVTAIGRANDNTLVLDDPFASSHHAIILWREGQWWVEDLESHNGTFLNENRLTEPAPLTGGDRLRIGETSVRFDLGSSLTESNLLPRCSSA